MKKAAVRDCSSQMAHTRSHTTKASEASKVQSGLVINFNHNFTFYITQSHIRTGIHTHTHTHMRPSVRL